MTLTRRSVIARSLAQEPAFLVPDEPAFLPR
jgi:ABC-type Mn2+/Zn2+ transport system ATPase subunit